MQQLATSSPDRSPVPPSRWRFRLRHLLMLVGHLCVLFGLIKWQGATGFALYLVLFITWRLFWGNQRTCLRVIQVLAVYAVVSMATLPLKNAWWIGELPMMALPQLPKTALAGDVRHILVMHVMGPLGLSRGSYSPDSTFARPYALAVVYVVPLAIWLTLIVCRTRLAAPYRYWLVGVLLLAIADYLMTLSFAGGPGLSFY